jgi:hypothetical protein
MWILLLFIDLYFFLTSLKLVQRFAAKEVPVPGNNP